MNSTIRRRGIAAVVSTAVMIAALTACSTPAPSTTEPADDTASLELITPGVLRVGVTGASEPYIFDDGSGVWQGFEADLVHYAAEYVGIAEVEFVQQDFSSLLAAVGNGQYDIAAACIGTTDERKKTVDYVADYNNGYLVLLAPTAAGITSADDLDGKRIGVTQGSIQEGYVKSDIPAAEAVGFPDSNANIQALLSGSVDASFADTDTAAKYIEQYPQLGKALEVSSPAPCGWPISYDKPNLKAALDKAIEAAIADGTVEKLTKQWLPDSPVLPEYTPAG